MENNTAGKLIHIDIEQEVKKSFISYAMAVNISRALPDARDGLKPVHRRILYTMHEMGLSNEKPFRKCARIVGDVMGKYHPHGDSSIYDALVRLAQDFSIRYTLVDGQGNFGSVDGDPAAASRYTEAKLSKIAAHILADIDKETVDFYPNFDETEMQPRVLPARFPNLLVNGSDGIAVGMATNIPPHNLRETINAAVALIENPDITIEELCTHLPGPDFPTGGLIMGRNGIKETYHTGRGRIVVRARTEIEQMTQDRARIVVTELPYQVNKARLIEKIADLHKEKRLEGISGLRDESDKAGMRIVIELKKDVNAQVVLNYLFKHTQMQDTFGAIMLALVDNEPRELNLKQILSVYLDHQIEVVTRRTQYDLDRTRARAHILEGLLRALDIIDEVIALIRSSKTTEIARNRLQEELLFSEEQAKSILDMRLQRLTGLERDRLQDELDEKMRLIAYYEEILGSRTRLLEVITQELLAVRDQFADERRTEITIAADDLDYENLIEEQEMVVTMTHFGYIKRLCTDTYRAQNRGGRGVAGLTTREEDFVEYVFAASTHTDLLFFSNKGKVYTLRCHQIPEAGRTAKGMAVVNLLQLEAGEKISAMIALPEDPALREGRYLMMATRLGYIKKTPLAEFLNIRKNGLIALVLREGDELMQAALTGGADDVLVVTRQGKAIRFEEKKVRSMGRVSMGVIAINLAPEDYAVNMTPLVPGKLVLSVTDNGYGKQSDPDEYRITNRGGKGIIAHGITEKTGLLADCRVVGGDEDIMLITSAGVIIRTPVAQISQFGRAAQGVRIMNVAGDVTVVCAAPIPHEELTEEDLPGCGAAEGEEGAGFPGEGPAENANNVSNNEQNAQNIGQAGEIPAQEEEFAPENEGETLD